MALIHYPVVDKNGETIASAVTNLDLHDIARAARTFGAKAFYVVTPLDDQIQLANQILDHWLTGKGAVYNPKRKKALELIRIKTSCDKMMEDVQKMEGCRPNMVVTSAVENERGVTYKELKVLLEKGEPCILALGTGWGLSKPFMDSADYVLEPIHGAGAYNHLSVRSAASIMMDRLLGQ